MAIYNKFTSLPFNLYRIIIKLIQNDIFCKLLYYNTYDCLSKPNLTYDEKIGMIWKSLDGKSMDNRMDEYNIFLTNTVSNEMTDSKIMLQCYHYADRPINHILTTIYYKFDFLYGSTTAVVEYEGYSCNRGDVFETELMKSLNGEDVAGVGLLQYNRGLDFGSVCGTDVGLGNNSTFTGISIILGTRIGDIDNVNCSQ
ncbi:MAG: hypothetical protein PHN69_06150 [Candidatus Pacebacteria bacterium]|nr:hypothetical protein [Candidatus Paceibacterota bacterium]